MRATIELELTDEEAAAIASLVDVPPGEHADPRLVSTVAFQAIVQTGVVNVIKSIHRAYMAGRKSYKWDMVANDWCVPDAD